MTHYVSRKYPNFCEAYNNRASGDSFAAPLYGHAFALTAEDGELYRSLQAPQYSYSRQMSNPYIQTKAVGQISPNAVRERYNCHALNEIRDARVYTSRVNTNCNVN